jgi:hypothetical protein
MKWSTRLLLSGLVCIAGLSVVFAQSQSRNSDSASNEAVAVDKMPAVDAIVELDKGLDALLLATDNSRLSIPFVYSRTHSERLKKKGLPYNEARRGFDFGFRIYNDLKKFGLKLQKMPLEEAEVSLRRMSRLRDALWEKKVLGNVVLSDLLNRMICREIAVRAIKAPANRMGAIQKLLPLYRDMAGDWQTVVTAIEAENDYKLNWEIIKNGIIKQPEDMEDFENFSLARKYVAISEQVAEKRVKGSKQDELETADLLLKAINVKYVLETGSSYGFLELKSVCLIEPAYCTRHFMLEAFVVWVGRRKVLLPMEKKNKTPRVTLDGKNVRATIPEYVAKKLPGCDGKPLSADRIAEGISEFALRYTLDIVKTPENVTALSDLDMTIMFP